VRLGIIAQARAEPAVIQVYKTPACGCSQGWVEHLRPSGFEVATRDLEDLTAVKGVAGVPERLQACRTAVVDGYTLEGHVPAVAIERLLSERPEIDGLAVPGKPRARRACRAPRWSATTSWPSTGDGAHVFGTFVGADEQ
jgi:hypothetical protein